MKIIAVSDAHVERHGYSALEEIAETEADVLITGGDIAHGNGPAEKAYSIFSSFPGIKLAYLGNHELSSMGPKIGQHYQELDAFYRNYGFRLLDASPFTLEGVSFIANSGWFDFSLYREEITPEILATAKRMMNIAYKQRDTSFAETCFEKLMEDYANVAPESEKVVVGIHHIFMKEMMRQDIENYNNIRDMFLGSTIYKKVFSREKVALGLTGHTHIPGEFKVHGKEIYNISYTKNKPFTVLEI